MWPHCWSVWPGSEPVFILGLIVLLKMVTKRDGVTLNYYILQKSQAKQCSILSFPHQSHSQPPGSLPVTNGLHVGLPSVRVPLLYSKFWLGFQGTGKCLLHSASVSVHEYVSIHLSKLSWSFLEFRGKLVSYVDWCFKRMLLYLYFCCKQNYLYQKIISVSLSTPLLASSELCCS